MTFQDVLGFYHETLNLLSHGDSTVKGFLVLGIMGALGWIGRTWPAMFIAFIRRNIIASMTFTRAGSYSMDLQNYAEFMRWFSESKWAKYDRNRRVTFDRDNPYFGPGAGFHWFIHNGRYFWFHVVRLNSSGTDIEKEEFTLYTFGRDTAPLEAIVEEFRIKPCKSSIRIFAPNDGDWKRQGKLRLDADETLIIDPDVEQEFFGSLDWYINNEAWYRKRGRAYKHTVILHGPPGTGKTSLIKRAARKYKRDLHFLNLSTHGRSLAELVAKLQPGDILCIEDFDDVRSLHRRVETKTVGVTDGDDSKSPGALLMDCDIALSTFLNVLQGVVELDDIIIIMTTNHLEKIDPAVYRRSRVDKLIEVLPLKDAEIKRYIDQMYDNPTYDRNVMYPDVPASTLSGIFQEHPDDHLAFINKLDSLDDAYIANNYALQPEPKRPPVIKKEPAPALEAVALSE
ncbi:cell division protein [Pseudomonas phage Psa21]|uniref:Cell division protein n=1 Tax=Pseudomonas phage Psa21 TaxID=2530023 RepID=A0A481W6I9_9CAUD|nr:cell division protein [Pseudomonas phage Psa21]QBJ02827.1 cell division protein [Pseudomonas phage Psa21]